MSETQRDTRKLDLGLGYEATLATYYTQGERFAIEELWTATAKPTMLKDASGSEYKIVYQTGDNYLVERRKLVYRPILRGLAKDGAAMDVGDVVAALSALPSPCFDVLSQAVNALTEPPAVKKAEPTA